jgi:predicted metal-dependent HD superfamily phosphohydrolase
MNFENLKNLVSSQLQGLDKRLYYHSPSHTLDDVLPNAILLSERAGLTENETTIVKLSALFHDTGFLDVYENNESYGCLRAQKMMKKFGYTSDQIDQVCKCIMATQMPQNPKTKMEQIVCDADLGYLGSNQFFGKSRNLLMELLDMENNHVKDLIHPEAEWMKMNLEFLEKHRYWTSEAIELFQDNKNKNIMMVQKILSEY